MEKLSGIRILAVDDNVDTRELMITWLQFHGAVVQAVGCAREALEAINAARFDALICDIGLPDEDGYSLIRKIRALGPDGGGAVPAVAVTGFVSDEAQLEAESAGYQFHLSKPVEPDHLLETLLRLIRQDRA